MKQIADIRNKLSPFANYLALHDKYNALDDELDKLDDELDAEYEKGNVDQDPTWMKLEGRYDKLQVEQSHIRILMDEELKMMHENMPLIINLLKEMDESGTNK